MAPSPIDIEAQALKSMTTGQMKTRIVLKYASIIVSCYMATFLGLVVFIYKYKEGQLKNALLQDKCVISILTTLIIIETAVCTTTAFLEYTYVLERKRAAEELYTGVPPPPTGTGEEAGEEHGEQPGEEEAVQEPGEEHGEEPGEEHGEEPGEEHGEEPGDGGGGDGEGDQNMSVAQANRASITGTH